uniref:Uncharacterized protein n=1 Tax=Phaeomonas parva TaxID=124430 RepID=A0A7S1TND8_9STRA
MSEKTAMKTYPGLTEADLATLTGQLRFSRGNQYMLYKTSDVEQLVREKRERDPAFAEQCIAAEKKREIKDARLDLKRAEDKITEIERRIEDPPLPEDGQQMSRTQAKRHYCLTDEEVKGIPSAGRHGWETADLRRFAEIKFGGHDGFRVRRSEFQTRTSRRELKEAHESVERATQHLIDLGVGLSKKAAAKRAKREAAANASANKRRKTSASYVNQTTTASTASFSGPNAEEDKKAYVQNARLELKRAEEEIAQIKKRITEPPLPPDGQHISKTQARKIFCLTDEELNVITPSATFGYLTSDLRIYAEIKFGGVDGFRLRRSKYQSRASAKELKEARANKERCEKIIVTLG